MRGMNLSRPTRTRSRGVCSDLSASPRARVLGRGGGGGGGASPQARASSTQPPALLAPNAAVKRSKHPLPPVAMFALSARPH